LVATPRVFLSWNTHPASLASPSRRRVGCDTVLTCFKRFMHNQKDRVKIIHKKNRVREIQPDQSFHKSFFLLFSYSLMTTWNLAHSKAKMLLSRCIEYSLLIDVNTSWLFIEKTFITACNWLNLQSNWLVQQSNRLVYLINRLKCSSQHLEITQE